MDLLIMASICEKSRLRIPFKETMDPRVFACILEKSRQFKQYEDELFEGPDSKIVQHYFRQLPKFDRHLLTHVAVLVNRILDHGHTDEPFSSFLVEASIFDDGLDVINGLRSQCYWYHRAVRRIQRWWRHHHYRPTGRGFRRAQNDFNSRCHGSNLS